MLRVFQYKIGKGVLTLEAFRGGGMAASGADLWPQTGHHGGSLVLEGWVVVNLSLEMLGSIPIFFKNLKSSELTTRLFHHRTRQKHLEEHHQKKKKKKTTATAQIH